MGSDDIFKRKKGQRRQRKENARKLAPYRYLIVCEGEKTEPNYFSGIKRRIEETYQNKIDIEILGTGRNTEDIVNFALQRRSLSDIPYDHVWIVFDKDDFADEQFNGAITKAEDNGCKVAWSNAAIEFWFLLHFEFLDAAIARHQYIKKLNEYFYAHEVNKGRYNKNLDNIFEILCTIGDINQAIERAKKIVQSFEGKGITSQAAMKPCTTIYRLVEELIIYI